MPKNSYLTPYEKGKIDAFLLTGKSVNSISKTIKRSRTAITNYIKRKDKYGIKKPTKGNSKLSRRDIRRVLHTASKTDLVSKDIKEQANVCVTPRRVRQILNQSENFKFLKLKKVPMLTAAHRKKRLEFAKKYMTWDTEWSNVMFSDEKRFNLDGPDGIHYYWHDIRREKQILSRRGHGGASLLIWAAFGMKAKTKIVFVKGRIDSNAYINILESNLLPVFNEEMVFQQDNAPVHVSHKTKIWIRSKFNKLLEWPSLSPDLNPIENLWGMLTRKVYEGGKQYNTVQELKGVITDIWNNIPQVTLANLSMSMKNRIYDLILAKGAIINY